MKSVPNQLQEHSQINRGVNRIEFRADLWPCLMSYPTLLVFLKTYPNVLTTVLIKLANDLQVDHFFLSWT